MQPPELVDITIHKEEIEVPGVIEVEVRGTDDIAGLESGRLYFENKVTNKMISVGVNGRGERNNETGEYQPLPEGILKGKIELEQYQLPGEYVLESVWIDDGAENIKNIPAPSDDEPPAKIGINYETGSKLTGDVFESIAGENKEITLEGGEIQWVFNGKDINLDNIKDIDLSVSISNLDQFNGNNVSNIEEIVQDKPTYVLSFPSNGQLPGKATMRLKVDYAFIEHLGREDLCIYYFDTSKGELVPIKSNVNVSHDGYVGFEIEHNSDFLVTKGKVQEEVKSTNASLKELTVNKGTLTPTFNKDTLNYTVEVENSVNTITIEGVAEDGETTKVYIIVVKRGSSSGSTSTPSKPATTKPATTEQVIEKLSKKDKEAIINNFKEDMPYTSLSTGLTLEQLKEFTNNKFTDKQLQEMLDKPELLEKLGINQKRLSGHIVLKPVENATFTDVPETHWASGFIKETLKLMCFCNKIAIESLLCK